MSTLLANTITALGGGGATVKVANDSTYISEGGAVTNQNLVQGLSKVWSVFDGTAGSIAYADSFNTSGLTDNGTGDYTIAISNDMASGNYAVASMGERLGSYEEVNINRHYSHAFAAGSFRLLANQADGVTNLYWVQTIAHGDLA